MGAVKPTHGTRSISNPRVREVLAAFDYFAESPAFGENPGLLDGFMQAVAFTSPDRFSCPTAWRPEAIRHVLIAHVLHAPTVDFRLMVRAARVEMEWIREFELDPTGRIRGHSLVSTARQQQSEAA